MLKMYYFHMWVSHTYPAAPACNALLDPILLFTRLTAIHLSRAISGVTFSRKPAFTHTVFQPQASFDAFSISIPYCTLDIFISYWSWSYLFMHLSLQFTDILWRVGLITFAFWDPSKVYWIEIKMNQTIEENRLEHMWVFWRIINVRK